MAGVKGKSGRVDHSKGEKAGRKTVSEFLKKENKTIRLNQLEISLIEKFGHGDKLSDKINFLISKGLEKLEEEGIIQVSNESLGSPFEVILEGLGENLVTYEVEEEKELAKFIVKDLKNVSSEVYYLVSKYNWKIEEA